MPRIMIHKLGPIEDCDMELGHFNVLTGAQASGKSTISKCIFFCRTIKDDIFDLILRKNLLGTTERLHDSVRKVLRNKFLQLFGTSKAMDEQMALTYYYGEETYIKISLCLQEGADYISPNYVWIDYSRDIRHFLNNFQEAEKQGKEELRQRLNKLFQDEYESVFIPAGRSLITLLTSQLNYLFATMDDEQKRSIDLCTQRYIERILKIRPLFENGVESLLEQKQNTPGASLDFKAIDEIWKRSKAVLKGRYVYRDGEERLYIDGQRFVKINFTSSGQQEIVWILNILQHLLLNGGKAFLILEEPEAHLYPEAQKEIVEILALMANKSCGMLLTTHSPYILGALNNLIYAGYLAKRPDIRERVIKIVGEELQIRRCNAYYLQKGKIETCTEPEEEGGLIVNEIIDGASSEINGQYDRLFNIEYGREE